MLPVLQKSVKSGTDYWRSYTPCVMVNFVCQHDWVAECPDTWSDIILGVSVRVFLVEINVWIRRLSKTERSPQCGWASFYQCKAWPHLSWRGYILPDSWLFLVLILLTIRLGLTVSSALLCCQLYHHGSQFFTVPLCLFLSACPSVASVSPENPKTSAKVLVVFSLKVELFQCFWYRKVTCTLDKNP